MNFNYISSSMNLNENKNFFIFERDEILVKKVDNKIIFPSIEDLVELKIDLGDSYLIDKYKNTNYYLGDFKKPVSLTEEYSFQEIRSIFGQVEENIFWILGRASHISHWNTSNKFCSNCGSSNIKTCKQGSIKCLNCNATFYPRISPAIIVAITKGDKILLAKNVNFKNDFYSVVAGFLEPGENLEACVRREIKEEVGIEVDNIEYFGSQPWPFPDSLMVGFTAEYAGSEIRIDGKELSHADWFSADNLPKIPSSISISRKLIDWFIDKNS